MFAFFFFFTDTKGRIRMFWPCDSRFVEIRSYETVESTAEIKTVSSNK